MDNTQKHDSEIARLLAQIRQEYEAAQQGMTGLAYGTCQHAFITRHMENMGHLHQELGTIVGAVPAIALIAEQLNDCPDAPSPPAK